MKSAYKNMCSIVVGIRLDENTPASVLMRCFEHARFWRNHPNPQKYR